MNSYKTILSKSIKTFISKPIILIPTILLFISFFFLSMLAQKFQTTFNTNTELIIFTIISLSIIFLVMSFFFSILIILNKQIIDGKIEISNSIKTSLKKTFKVFLVILITLLVYNIIQEVAYYLATFIGDTFSLEINPAKLVYFILYFAGIIGILLFFSLSVFILVLKDKSILESIFQSFKLVKQNYLFILSIFVVIFAISQLSALISSLFSDILDILIITPLLSIIFTKLILDNDIRTT